ncbi:Protein of unknown function [Pyronema omphalodes CBS 100304]|uniref:Uncharacterized protein n=1 Tax=Pyronema omphalodes (strain CBS 100304) TaxID=1076935 RepID=U4L6G8_PYROM|nr:Protein of unknown function [Pyronema omphalodes CBS 100304]
MKPPAIAFAFNLLRSSTCQASCIHPERRYPSTRVFLLTRNLADQ